MLNKYLFYYISWFNKKVDLFGGGTDEYCYYGPSILVGMTLAVILYTVINVFSIFFIRNYDVYEIVSNIMFIFCCMMGLISFLYFKHNNRWEIIYKEIQNKSTSLKCRYGIYSLLYVFSVYGLFFFSNDVIRVLNTGEGLSLAKSIVNTLNIAYW